ncbi:HTH-type transcriptional regulator GalR [soil metagenome]
MNGKVDGSTRVSEATRQRVLAAVHELGYKPNLLARGLRINRSGGVGVVVKALHTSFNGRLLSGVEKVIGAAGMHLMVSSGRGQAESERVAIEFLLARRCDALIVSLSATTDESLVALSRADRPIIVVGHRVPGLEHRCVALDDVLGGSLATRHLLDKGHRQIAHISGPANHRTANDRLTGYKQALAEAGYEVDSRFIVEGDFSKQGGFVAAGTLLERGFVWGGLFVANDRMAEGVLERLRAEGLGVPGDVSVVGYDDASNASYLRPALTTVHQPIREMGSAAARLALKVLGMNDEEVKKCFEPELVVRNSVAALG